jgi:hypothetical protein
VEATARGAERRHYLVVSKGLDVEDCLLMPPDNTLLAAPLEAPKLVGRCQVAVRRRDRQPCWRQLPPVFFLSLRSEGVGLKCEPLARLHDLQKLWMVVPLSPHDQSQGQLPPLQAAAATPQEQSELEHGQRSRCRLEPATCCWWQAPCAPWQRGAASGSHT